MKHINMEVLEHVSAEDLLSQVIGGYYKQTMSDMEIAVWMAAIDTHGDAVVKRFLVHHMSRSTFPPKVSDLMSMVAPEEGSALAAFEALRLQVAQCGPYRAPSFSDPAIALAVQALGGWVRVNNEMPSPGEDRFAYDSYAKRFAEVYRVACAQVALQTASVPRLTGLHEVGSRPALAAPSGAGAAIMPSGHGANPLPSGDDGRSPSRQQVRA